ncbi:hypothetical protein ACFQH2_08440 [Natronoarchaeum sp. GCM10025703]|uniref:hypothetical protein n=1 Tax=unclassified Natronoarchaeum TaxID=2620183 RepID=UPI00360C7C0A
MSLALAIVGVVLLLMGLSGYSSPEGMMEAQNRYPVGPTDDIESETQYRLTRFASVIVAAIGAALLVFAYL